MTENADFPLARYDSMCHAITECVLVDEVKDIRDKALALRVYYRQAGNLEAERLASQIRLRAERRSGELLAELERATPKGGDLGNQHTGGKSATIADPPSPYRETLDRVGIPPRTATRFQALAAVPAAVFEEHLQKPSASTNSIIEAARDPQPQMPEDSLWLWGRLREFEARGYFEKDPRELVDAMTPAMQSEVYRVLPRLLEFLGRIEEVTT